MTVSHWRRTTRLGTIECHTAVVGGGITGVAAALALERRGVDALIIERGEIGSGASMRNAGFLMRGAADNYAAAIRDWGRESARHVWRLTEENLAMLRAEGIESLPTYKRIPSCLLALDEGEAAELHESERLMREDGFEVSVITSGRDAAWRSGKVTCGLMNPNDGACNPREVLWHLAGKLKRPPMPHQEVAGLSIEGPERVMLTLQDGIVLARRVLIATNAYSPLLLPKLTGLIEPRRGQILAFKVPNTWSGPLFDCSYYANHGGEYFRQPSTDVAIVGGWRRFFKDTEVGYEDRITVGVQAGLEKFISGILPDGFPIEVVARWSGVMGFTRDGLPLVGPIDAEGATAGLESPIWLCAGYTGHGMSMAFKTAHEAVEGMLNGARSRFSMLRQTSSPQATTH